MKLNLKLLNNYVENGLLFKNNHPSLPLVIWNYTAKTQYRKLWDETTTICRALVTDLDGIVVAKSFDKFFNLEEEDDLPQEPFEVYEKLDGSLILVFWFDNKLVVCSKGSFSSVHSLEAKSILDGCDQSVLDKTKSYSFELIVPWNKIVCDYGNERKLVLLAKFDNEGLEYDTSIYSKYFSVPKKFEFDSLYEIKNHVPPGQEGYVVKFIGGKRVKIKGLEYVKIHKLISNISEKSIFDMLSSGQASLLEELVQELPDEFHGWATETKSKIESKFKDIICKCKDSFKRFGSRKECAQYFTTQKYSSVLFSMLDNKDIEDAVWRHTYQELKEDSFFL